MTDICVSVAHDGWQDLTGVGTVIEEAVSRTLASYGPAGLAVQSELAVELADDATVRALNHQFRHTDKPTNVLSFPGYDSVTAAVEARSAHGGDAPPLLLGDIILAYETVMREAAQQGKPPLDHVRHLAVHGTLHLLGYDHEIDDEAEEMEAMERRILAAMGVPDPYAAEITTSDL